MAKKNKNSGLGRGLDSLIPNIDEENEVEEGISLEDLMKNSTEEKAEAAEEEIEEKVEAEISKEIASEDDSASLEDIAKDKPANKDTEEKNIKNETEKKTVKKETKEKTVKKDTEEKTVKKETKEKTVNDAEEKKENPLQDDEAFANVLGNDDEIVEVNSEKSETAKVDYKEELSTKTVDKLSENSAQEKASEIKEEESIKNAVDDESIANIEDAADIIEDESFLTKDEEKNISEIIETVEKNPRITLWSAKSAAVLRYLRKTQPEFSISKEASKLIDEAIAEEYPEIWTLFNHL